MAAPSISIEATDLSPIQSVGPDEDAWLRSIAKRSNLESLSLRLSKKTMDDEPIVYFDARSGSWWAGRHIGEISSGNGTLRIMPRYGVPQLQRWLTRIWGVRMMTSKGRYESSQLWLWELLAKLWESRLLAAAKHGLPTKRFEESHKGSALRGRLDIRATARELGSGRRNLVSVTRNRSVDRAIASIVLCAFENLRGQLSHLGSHRYWLTQRAQTIIESIQSQYGARVSMSAIPSNPLIRYTPITESYRPVVELSMAILKQRPMSQTKGGDSDVIGVLIDMAEVWEMYLYQLLKSNVLDAEVVHSGRDDQNEGYLLTSTVNGNQMGGLKPDILIRSFATNRLLAILDAKYKNTGRNRDRPNGLHREDLYQMNAYLSALSGSNPSVAGGLIYPSDDSMAIVDHQAASPWSIPNADASFWLLGMDCQSCDLIDESITAGEFEFIRRVRHMASCKPAGSGTSLQLSQMSPV